VTAIVEARGVAVRRGKREVLHGIDVTVTAGEALAVVGPNAAGKSTLLRALCGLLPLSAGAVFIGGRALGEWPRDGLARIVALVTPEDEAVSPLTVRERVAVGRYPHTGPFRPLASEDHRAIDSALELTGIAALAERRVGTLSAGERQLASVARGLAQQPQVLLLDEPAAHLDIGHQLALFRVLDDIRGRGVAVLAVVHDLQRAASWAERLIVVAGGSIAASGEPHAVLASAEAASVFGVAIRAHRIDGQRGPLYTFDAIDARTERA
jgi:ABC-type cobalamin/Fe3+-siderophores transport system ATPase subunit